MEFKREQLFYIIVFGFIILIFSIAKSMNNYISPKKCIAIKNRFLKAILLVDKTADAVSGQSIVFIIFGYLLGLSVISVNVVSLFLTEKSVEIILLIVAVLVLLICSIAAIVFEAAKKKYWRYVKADSLHDESSVADN